jgi:hypothetical protein
MTGQVRSTNSYWPQALGRVQHDVAVTYMRSDPDDSMLPTLLDPKMALRRHAPAGMSRSQNLGEASRRDQPWAKTAGRIAFARS